LVDRISVDFVRTPNRHIEQKATAVDTLDCRSRLISIDTAVASLYCALAVVIIHDLIN
jgi:hypothetical protein